MVKRKITEYLGQILMLLCIVLLFLQLFWGAAVLYIVWYALYGFVGLSFFFSASRKITLSNILLSVTFYPTLLPFRKAFYFWTKSVNTILKDATNTEKAYSLAKKVDIDKLYTDHNKAFFLSYLASLYTDLGDKEKARKCIDEAQRIPHKKVIDEMINRVKDEIAK